MPRPRKQVPELKSHISGQDRVWLDGKRYYCGPTGSAGTQARFDTLVAKSVANGSRMPDDEPTHQAEAPITVANVCAEFRRHIEIKFANHSMR